MGAPSAPTYANIFMAVVDIWFENCAIDERTLENLILFIKRFIDDFLLFWTGSEDQLLKFMTKINSIHPTIKFTCSYNLEARSTNFLDLTITITDDGIVTDLYRKETDRVQYLLPSSCHPAHIFHNVPYSLALRLMRICSQKEDLVKRFEELSTMLKNTHTRKSAAAIHSVILIFSCKYSSNKAQIKIPRKSLSF